VTKDEMNTYIHNNQDQINHIFGHWELLKQSNIVSKTSSFLHLVPKTHLGMQLMQRLKIEERHFHELLTSNPGTTSSHKSLKSMHAMFTKIPVNRSNKLYNFYVVLILLHWAYANDLPWEAEDVVIPYRLTGTCAMVFRFMRSAIKNPLAQREFDKHVKDWVEKGTVVQFGQYFVSLQNAGTVSIEIVNGVQQNMLSYAVKNTNHVETAVELMDVVNRLVRSKRDENSTIFAKVNKYYSVMSYSSCDENIRRITRIFPLLIPVLVKEEATEKQLIKELDKLFRADDSAYKELLKSLREDESKQAANTQKECKPAPEPEKWCFDKDSLFRKRYNENEKNDMLRKKKNTGLVAQNMPKERKAEKFYTATQISRSIHWIDQRLYAMKNNRNFERARLFMKMYPDRRNNFVEKKSNGEPIKKQAIDAADLSRVHDFCKEYGLNVFSVAGDLDRITILGCQWINKHVDDLLKNANILSQTHIDSVVESIRYKSAQLEKETGIPTVPICVSEYVEAWLDENEIEFPEPLSQASFGKIARHLGYQNTPRHLARAKELLQGM